MPTAPSSSPTDPAPARRPTMLLGALVVAGAVAACGSPTPASGTAGPGPAGGEAIEVVMTDNAFTPADVAAAAGDDVTIEVRNDGGQVHDFVVEELDLSTGGVAPGEVAHATLAVPEDGLTFACTIHPGMEGRITAS